MGKGEFTEHNQLLLGKAGRSKCKAAQHDGIAGSTQQEVDREELGLEFAKLLAGQIFELDDACHKCDPELRAKPGRKAQQVHKADAVGGQVARDSRQARYDRRDYGQPHLQPHKIMSHIRVRYELLLKQQLTIVKALMTSFLNASSFLDWMCIIAGVAAGCWRESCAQQSWHVKVGIDMQSRATLHSS